MITAQEIEKLIDGQLHGDNNLIISGVFDLIPGKTACISFLDTNKSSIYLEKTESDLIIVPNNFDYSNISKSVILVKNPKESFFKVIKKYFYSNNFSYNPGVHNTAIISSEAKIDKNVYIGENVVIEANVIINSGAKIGSNCFIGSKSKIGNDSILHPNVTIYKNIIIGSNVEINSASVIGSNGFGILKKDNKLIQVPHIGKVIVEDDVILGAGCTIDRATISNTIIGQGTKIDGQVHIAHNVKIGKNCIISGQSAIGGSTTLGNNVVLGGQVGIIDNLSIGNNCKVAAKSAVMKSLDDDSIVSGIPAIGHNKKRRLDVLYYKLPELFKKIKNI